jgi:hypothetical protein
MPAPHETLLVCFLGDPSVGSSDLPRVVVDTADGRIEEVALSRNARQLLRVLALPRNTSLAGLTARGSTTRLADVLASPPPQRRTGEVAEILYVGRSQMDRNRSQLRRELERQRLDSHLYSEARGWIGLRNAITDVALLFGAVRDERWEAAARLLTIVAPNDPRAAQLLPDKGWSAEAGAHIAAALTQAKHNLPASVRGIGPEPSRLPERPPQDEEEEEEEEVLEGKIVDEMPGQVVLAGPRAIMPWPGRRRHLRRALVATLLLLLLAIGTVALGRQLFDSGEQPSSLEISATRAGPWPEHATGLLETNAELANLTREIPFGAPLVAKPGDTLLAGVRIDVTKDSDFRKQPFEINTTVDPESFTEDNVSMDFIGPSLPHDGGGVFTVGGMTPRNRLQIVPDSTVLLDEHNDVIRHLPNISLGHPDYRPGHLYRLPHLKVGRLYYVEWRLESVEMPDSVKGQIAQSSPVRCTHPHQKDPNTEAEVGDTLDCWLDLTNWGSGTLRDVQVHLSWSGAESPHQLTVSAWASSEGSQPRVIHLLSDYLTINPIATGTTLEYVPGSSKLATIGGQVLSDLDDLEEGKLAIPELGAGLANARRLVLKLRVVPTGPGKPRATEQSEDLRPKEQSRT